MTATPNQDQVAEVVGGFVQMCADFESMGTGDFRRKYPDYRLNRNVGHGPEGVGYITRKAKELQCSVRHLLSGHQQ